MGSNSLISCLFCSILLSNFCSGNCRQLFAKIFDYPAEAIKRESNNKVDPEALSFTFVQGDLLSIFYDNKFVGQIFARFEDGSTRFTIQIKRTSPMLFESGVLNIAYLYMAHLHYWHNKYERKMLLVQNPKASAEDAINWVDLHRRKYAEVDGGFFVIPEKMLSLKLAESAFEFVLDRLHVVDLTPLWFRRVIGQNP